MTVMRPPEPGSMQNFHHALTALVVCATFLASCSQQAPPQAPPPVEVGAVTVQPQGLALSLEHAAQLRGVREVEVRARVSGILLKRLYREGARVKANEVLLKIDPAPFQAQAARARAEVGVQQATFQQADRDRDRVLALYDQKLVSLRDRDNAVAAFESAQANVAAAKAALRSAELDLSYTDVRAPIAGLTSREVRSEGSLVTKESDSSLLTHIVQADKLYVQFSMPESEAESLRAAVNGANADQVFVSVLNIQGVELAKHAPVEFIAPSVGNETGTVDVRAVIGNEKGTLLPGQVVRARVEGVTLAGSLVIPKRAVLHGAQGSFVWGIGADNKIAFAPVQLGATSGNNVVVTSGLAPGARVVVDGILKVQPGAVVKPVAPLADGGPLGAPADRPAQPAEKPAAPQSGKPSEASAAPAEKAAS
ncbi:MAG: efflux RND transporter periplasmic adaptor subunit [Gammaproteobacteria bacterium]